MFLHAHLPENTVQPFLTSASPEPTARRQLLAALVLLPLARALPVKAASVLTDTARSAMVAFDAVYIPALFLTGSAGKSAEGPAKAEAAMKRLLADWSVRRAALAAALPGAKVWTEALDNVGRYLTDADKQVTSRHWEDSHATLEHVREAMFKARQSLGVDYALDHYTVYHGAMEALANTTTVQRAAMEADYTKARALWRGIEQLTLDSVAYGLSAPRQGQLRQALIDETEALSRLSAALRGASDADLLKAAAALKAPFVRAYVAFGWAPGETPVLPG